MKYQEKIFVVQGSDYDTPLALCEFNEQSKSWEYKFSMTESRYSVLLSKRDFTTLTELAACQLDYPPGSPEWQLVRDAKLIVKKIKRNLDK
jgi:hypothetical protein